MRNKVIISSCYKTRSNLLPTMLPRAYIFRSSWKEKRFWQQWKFYLLISKAYLTHTNLSLKVSLQEYIAGQLKTDQARYRRGRRQARNWSRPPTLGGHAFSSSSSDAQLVRARGISWLGRCVSWTSSELAWHDVSRRGAPLASVAPRVIVAMGVRNRIRSVKNRMPAAPVCEGGPKHSLTPFEV